jgi:hypothetical protein
VLASARTSFPLPRNESLSGLVLGLLLDFPGWKASLNFLPGDIPRIELLMLFLRPDREPEGSPRVLDRSNRVGEDREDVELVAGSEGECIMEGILDGLRVGLCTGSAEDNAGLS